MARIPANGVEMNQFLAKQALDLGCYGIMWPHISTVEEAYNAVAACRYARLKDKPLYEPQGIRGDGPMQPDLIAGRLGFAGVLPSSFLGQVKAGNLRLLAMLPERRHPAFPEVPTLTESGIPVVQLSFGGVLVPAKMPAPIVAMLEAACEKAVASPAMQTWAAGASQVLAYASGAAFAERLRKDSAAKAATLKRLKLAAE
jgi:tripartite-type tricarboxylate transporter receptor subunit TctC